MQTLERSKIALGVLAAALFSAAADDARAQAGDLDILSRAVPPIVMLQVDSSGSMRNIILPQKYLTDRGAGNPAVWFNAPNDPNSLASQLDTTYLTPTDPNNQD